MGFGLLFLGYFIATLMSINMLGSLFRIVGYSIILIAAGKLNKYNRSFRFLEAASVLMILVSVFIASADVCDFLYSELIIKFNPFGTDFISVMGYAEMFASLVFNSLMLYAIREIAKETDVIKIVASAFRNFVFICIYYVLYFIGVLPFEFSKEYAKFFSAPVLILYFVWIVLNLVLIYSCYAKICDENDVEMQRKPSRFSFVNNMRAKFDEREQKAFKEHAEYKREKRERRRNRRK